MPIGVTPFANASGNDPARQAVPWAAIVNPDLSDLSEDLDFLQERGMSRFSYRFHKLPRSREWTEEQEQMWQSFLEPYLRFYPHKQGCYVWAELDSSSYFEPVPMETLYPDTLKGLEDIRISIDDKLKWLFSDLTLLSKIPKTY